MSSIYFADVPEPLRPDAVQCALLLLPEEHLEALHSLLIFLAGVSILDLHSLHLFNLLASYWGIWACFGLDSVTMYLINIYLLISFYIHGFGECVLLDTDSVVEIYFEFQAVDTSSILGLHHWIIWNQEQNTFKSNPY